MDAREAKIMIFGSMLFNILINSHSYRIPFLAFTGFRGNFQGTPRELPREECQTPSLPHPICSCALPCSRRSWSRTSIHLHRWGPRFVIGFSMISASIGAYENLPYLPAKSYTPFFLEAPHILLYMILLVNMGDSHLHQCSRKSWKIL